MSKNSPSRRAIVAALALSPCAALPAVANVPGSPDPVFAALAARDRAEADWLGSFRAFDEAEQQYWDRRIDVAVTMPDGQCVKTRGQLETYYRVNHPVRFAELREQVGRAMDRVLKSKGSVIAPQPVDPPAPAEIRAFKRSVADTARKLREAEAEDQRLREQTGFDAAEAEKDRLGCISSAADKMALETIPTTLQGAAALLRFARRYIVEDMGDDENAAPAIEAVAEFIEGRLAHV